MVWLGLTACWASGVGQPRREAYPVHALSSLPLCEGKLCGFSDLVTGNKTSELGAVRPSLCNTLSALVAEGNTM